MKNEIQKQSQEVSRSQSAERMQHYLRLKYPMEIIEDEDGVVATIPDLPGCASFGDTIEAAVRGLNETKELWIKGRVDSGQPVPDPSQIETFSGKFVLRIPRSLHRSLDREAKKQGVSLNQYILHLLSERHAKTKIDYALEQSAPLFANFQNCYVHANDVWVGQARSYHFSPAEPFDSTESLLGNLEFLAKPTGFRMLQPAPKDLRKVYEGKI
jgi:antitoxin HicB